MVFYTVNRFLLPFAILILSCGSDTTLAGELRCKSNGVIIFGIKAVDRKEGCRAVAIAGRFLESAGLSIPKNVTISLVSSRGTSSLTINELGRYSGDRKAITVLDYYAAVKATKDGKAGLDRIVTRGHWRSYIVHELAHAAFHIQFDISCPSQSRPSRAIHEYVAGVAQLTALPKNELDKLLSNYLDVAPFGDLTEVSVIYYAFNPHQFAVKSYKHYQQQENPRALLKDALCRDDDQIR